ncbi:hypothetical protein R4227_05835, partial [Gordonia amicalis]|nr:hypothetical protein [Gordonia amicalis]MDV7099664.1 hypothetical protein [Gordonia amicalis]
MTTTLAAVVGQIRRGTRAELTRVGGARSILLYGLIPGAVLGAFNRSMQHRVVVPSVVVRQRLRR